MILVIMVRPHKPAKDPNRHAGRPTLDEASEPQPRCACCNRLVHLEQDRVRFTCVCKRQKPCFKHGGRCLAHCGCLLTKAPEGFSHVPILAEREPDGQ